MRRVRTAVLLCVVATAGSPLFHQATGDVLGAQPAGPTPGAPTPLPSVALPPALDRVLRDYEAAWRARDAAALAALFTDDGFVLQGGRPPVRGRAAIALAYDGLGGGSLRLRALAFDTAQGLGYIIGAYGYDGGQAASDIGKFTLTLRRDDGDRWRIVSDMDNPSAAPRRIVEDGEDDPELLSLDRRLFESMILAQDSTLLLAVSDPSYVVVAPGGVVETRAQAIRGLRAFAAVDSLSLTKPRVVRRDAMAIVLGRLRLYGTLPRPLADVGALTTQTVYRRDGGTGRWLVVSRTLTPCRAEAAARGLC